MDFSKEYDSLEAITESIKSLETFNQLISARHIAGYREHKRLREWVVLGRFMLDSCGNFMKILDNQDYYIVPAKRTPNFPKVASNDFMKSYMQSLEKPNENLSICSTLSWLPPAKQICPVCKKGWTIDNCHDFVDGHDDKVIDAKDFVGQTVADFKAKWNHDNHEIYWFLRGETNLRNKKYIDRTILVNDIWKAENKHQINERGWVETNNDHILEPGDFLYIHQVTYRHYKCYRTRQAKIEKAFFQRIFQSAGFEYIEMYQIPNQYHHDKSCTACAPWYNVYTDSILFTIGWRKRVINIRSDDPRINFESLFADQDVSKGSNFIHAWGREKCIEYLRKVRKSL